MFVWHNRKAFSAARVLVFALMAACTEKLESGAACPALCPEQNIVIRDTTIVFDSRTLVDTTIAGFPGIGLEQFVLLALRSGGGASLDTRGVIRFDSLENRFRPAAADTLRPITTLDSAFLKLKLGRVVRTAEVTIDAYDVGATDDTTTAALLPFFDDPAKLLGSRTFATTDSLRDSVNVQLSSAKVLAKLTASGTPRFRLGLRVRSSAPVEVSVGATNGGGVAMISYDPSPDTAVKAISNNPLSLTPVGEPAIASALADFTLLVATPPPPDRTTLAVGGLPGRRIYLRFDSLPAVIVDSSTVIRATLTLTQVPNPALGLRDTVAALPQIVVAGPTITDPALAVRLLVAPGLLVRDTVRVSQADSGSRELELVTLLRSWRISTASKLPRALALTLFGEGHVPSELRFYSSDPAVPANLRPRLRISYIPRAEIGLP